MNRTFTVAPGDTITIMGVGAGASTGDGMPPLPGAGGSGPGGGSTPPGSGGGTTSGNVRTIPYAWSNSPNTSIGELGHDEVVVIEVTTGNVSSGSTTAMIRGSEFGGGAPWNREFCLSYKAGDFDNPIDNAPYARGEGPSPTARFTVGNGYSAGYPAVPLNTTIYMNVRNVQPAAESDWPASTQMQFSVFVGPL